MGQRTEIKQTCDVFDTASVGIRVIDVTVRDLGPAGVSEPNIVARTLFHVRKELSPRAITRALGLADKSMRRPGSSPVAKPETSDEVSQ